MLKTGTTLVLLVGFLLQIDAQQSAQWRGPERNGIYTENGLLKAWPEKGPELEFSVSDVGKATPLRCMTGGCIM